MNLRKRQRNGERSEIVNGTKHLTAGTVAETRATDVSAETVEYAVDINKG